MFKHLYIEPTNRCNLRCFSCLRDYSARDEMSLEIFKEILYKIIKSIGKPKQISFFWRGEPTLNPKLPEMVRVAASEGIYTYVSTNSTLLYKENYARRLLKYLDKIELCVDGYNQETIEKYRSGISFEAVIKSLRTVGNIRSKTLREMRVLMFRWNDGKEDFYRDLAKRYNFDLISFALPIIYLGSMSLTKKIVNEYLHPQRKYQRYERRGDIFIHKGAPHCTINVKEQPIIAVDGTIYPCCYDRFGQFPLGNILTDDLREINRRIEEIQPLMYKKALLCWKYCFNTTIKTDYKEIVNLTSLLKKLIFNSLNTDPKLKLILFRLKKSFALAKSIFCARN